ncbi:MAG: flagellar hook-length control protein FliK [Lachnospiraceae bacterium]|nr:flagellar hook-length control protein FliK [Lachnospiraceae bacterium]
MAIISNTVQNNTRGSSSAVTPRSRAYRSGNSMLQLREGQTLKGVISDIHGSEITLSMEDGSSFTGKLPDASQYSIGQKAAFQITSLDNNTIFMKTLTDAYLLDMEDTIEQALEEAGLPKTPRNLDVVRSLLQNQQSISRESILSSIRLCAQFPEADVNAVITMRRLNLPMTPESVRQFENYQNQSHQLLYKMDSLTDSINDMLASIGNQVPRLAKGVGSQLLAMALEGGLSPEEATLLQNAGEASGEAGAIAYDAEGNPLSGSTEGAAEDDIIAGKETTGAEGEALADAMAETAKEAETAGGPLSRMKQLFSNLTDGNAAMKNAVADSGLAEDYRTPFIPEQAGFILPPEEREAFAKFLSDFPLPESLQEGLADGTITAREFLTEVQQAFDNMTDSQAGSLLGSKSFQSFVKAQFLSGWTLSPESLKQENALDKVYDKMSRQFEALSNFSEQTLGQNLFTQVSNTASDMSENLDFMKALNQTFQYIQLPLKLQNQNAHGDLYVMTRKEALKKDPKHLKVLLHLDMEHLGTLDIQIARENSAVSARFFVASKETKELLERNMELLSDAINHQGYAFSSELSLKEKDVDIVNDFIAAEAPPVGDLKRYNFDLRA